MDAAVRVALIPFYGGTSTATHSREDTRERYLKDTLESVREFGFRPHVGVVDKEDALVAMKLTTDDEVVQAFPYEEPRWLPVALFQWAQSIPADLVYATEADQVLRALPPLDLLDGINVMTPHRFEEIGSKGQGKDRGPVRLDGTKTYVLPNTELPDTILSEFYWPWNHSINDVRAHLARQFGGAFLCSGDFFRRVEFERSLMLPVEHATGFNVCQQGFCLKTTDPKGFYVLHLSGLEYHEGLS